MKRVIRAHIATLMLLVGFIPHMHVAAKRRARSSTQSFPQKVTQFRKSLIQSLQADIRASRTSRHTKVQGFNESKNRNITFDYEHILAFDLQKNASGKLELSGCHHDYKGRISKSPLFVIKNKRMGKKGFYRADVLIGGNTYKKSFFPSNWTSKKVIDTIAQAYKDFKKSNRKPVYSSSSGNYRVTGYIPGGVEIEMFINKQGKIVTAYPKKI